MCLLNVFAKLNVHGLCGRGNDQLVTIWAGLINGRKVVYVIKITSSFRRPFIQVTLN